MKHPNGHFREKPCRVCGTTFQPEAPSNLYCSAPCKDAGNANAYYMRTYGITIATVRTMFEKQNHRCALCGGAGFKMADHHRVPLVVDHCHATGKVRRLLCHNCNRALGLLKESPELIRAAADYIEAHREGATTIPSGSRPQAIGGRSAVPWKSPGEDIVWTRRQRRAAPRERAGA